MIARASESGSVLLVVVGRRTCALSLRHVVETMRPLPVEPVAGSPRGVRGLAVIRGVPTPVLDLAALLDGDDGAGAAAGARLVTLDLGGRPVALAVDAVIGVRTVDPAGLAALPPLAGDGGPGPIDAIGARDAQLLLVLEATRLVSAEVWAALEAAR